LNKIRSTELSRAVTFAPRQVLGAGRWIPGGVMIDEYFALVNHGSTEQLTGDITHMLIF
jgi:hypothetical protein